MASNTQYLRLRRREDEQQKATQARHSQRHDGILQDQIRRSMRAPWCPSLSLAFRILLLVRFSGAMYSNISDCDEVYNFWEPLHYLARGYGFQTWEVSPAYAIRSWAYIVLHLLPATLPTKLLSLDKRQSFFALRIVFAFISSYCEAKLYRTVVEKINYRVGRYLFFALLFSSGMWISSTAFLPSSFAMYANTLAFARILEPPSLSNGRRTLVATVLFAVGAIVGWPFALAIAIPFVFEELFVHGTDIVSPDKRLYWALSRFRRLVLSGSLAALLFAPVVFIDSIAYGSLTVVPWNIVKYNIFGGVERGPDLYGTEPWFFYIRNNLLNFNVLLPLALASLPALLVTYHIDKKRLGASTKQGASATSPSTSLAVRLLPFYVWFGILSSQPHKEERFMFPAYPILAFNSAVTIYLIRGWIETTYIKVTKSPYKASKSSLFSLATLSIMSAFTVLSTARVLALCYYYHAPLEVVYHFESRELPRVLNVTGLLLPTTRQGLREGEEPRVDLSPIKSMNITLCIGKEWHRFPSHWLIPDGVHVGFIKSGFDGLLPRHFDVSSGSNPLWPRDATRHIPDGLNDLNMEEPSQYVDISSCQYLLDLDFPHRQGNSPFEPRYAVDHGQWDRVYCAPFLDAAHSSLLTRTLWLPGESWQKRNNFGDYCLLKRTGLFQSPVGKLD